MIRGKEKVKSFKPFRKFKVKEGTTTLMTVSDNAILTLLQDPDNKRKGFELLMDTYKERLYWHIRRMVNKHEDTDDLLQDVFIKVWKSIDKFQGNSKLYTWLYRIATNETLTFLNKQKRMQVVGMEQNDYDLSETLKADPYFDGNDIKVRLETILNGLPEKQRLVFQMRYYDEMKYQQISDILETSIGALKASYHHAVKKIEAALKA